MGIPISQIRNDGRKMKVVYAKYIISILSKRNGYKPLEISEVINTTRSGVYHYFDGYQPPQKIVEEYGDLESYLNTVI